MAKKSHTYSAYSRGVGSLWVSVSGLIAPPKMVRRLARACRATTATDVGDIQMTDLPASTANFFGCSRGSVILEVTNYLRLASAPTFAIMALLTGVVGNAKDLLCSATHDASPLTGMATMYLFMSIFHSPPWLKLISRR
jgi:hypothetical protein